jgi:hypothetical protein
MLTHRSRVRTKRKASTVSRKGPQFLDNFESTRNGTRGQGHPWRAPNPLTFLDLAASAVLTVWTFVGLAIHLGWPS